MKLERNKKTGIVESFDDNGNKIGEVITMGDMVKKDDKEDGEK